MAQFRHEWKHEISLSDRLALQARLGAVCAPDPHAPGGQYRIRSLYFDTPSDKALREKLNGVDRREKFRLRYYNSDLTLIRLEKKSKRNGLGTKFQSPLTAAEAQLAAAQEEIATPKRGHLPEELRRDLWVMTTTEAETSRARMAEAAEKMAVGADNPACVLFKDSVARYRAEKVRAEAMEQRAAELDALEVKTEN